MLARARDATALHERRRTRLPPQLATRRPHTVGERSEELETDTVDVHHRTTVDGHERGPVQGREEQPPNLAGAFTIETGGQDDGGTTRCQRLLTRSFEADLKSRPADYESPAKLNQLKTARFRPSVFA